jgi:asparagine synthase (glutamine-hydrolysing)
MFHNIPVEFRRFGKDKIEKLLLRDAFREGDWLPNSIINRKKHAFSDAINSKDTCFYKEVEKYAETIINKNEWEQRYDLYPNNTPITKESFYYRKIFENNYPNRSNLIRGYWLPKIKDENGNIILNPSATALPGHKVDTEF